MQGVLHQDSAPNLSCSTVCLMLFSKALHLRAEHGGTATPDALHLQILRCWETSRLGPRGSRQHPPLGHQPSLPTAKHSNGWARHSTTHRQLCFIHRESLMFGWDSWQQRGTLPQAAFPWDFRLNETPTCFCVSALSRAWLSVTPWTVARQDPLSTGFSRQEYCSGLWFLPPRDLPNLGMEPTSLASPALAGWLSTTVPPAKPTISQDSRLNYCSFFLNLN